MEGMAGRERRGEEHLPGFFVHVALGATAYRIPVKYGPYICPEYAVQELGSLLLEPNNVPSDGTIWV